MTMSLAQTIVSNARDQHTLLNWDGNNTKADLLENIRHYVSNFSGHKLLSVEFENNVLEIAAKKEDDSVETLLTYNVQTGREIYGRLRHVGFYFPHLEELKVLMTVK